MRLVTARIAGREAVGAILSEEGLILDFAAAAARRLGDRPEWTQSMLALIDGGGAALDAAAALVADPPEEAVVAAGDAMLLAPLPRPRRIRDCSLFLEHLRAALLRVARLEAQRSADPEGTLRELVRTKYKLPELFNERVLYYSCDPMGVSGPEQEIVWPMYSKSADYELEWAAVIGTGGKHIARDKASTHIFGFTIFNDWSARDEQMLVMAAGVGPGEGKDFDGSVGLGPCIATPDEFSDPYALQMTARVNGEVRCQGTTSSMRWTFEDAIEQLSRFNTLHAGEVLGSGTVLGGCGFETGVSLADDDFVELEVEGIGTLRNRVRIPALTEASR